MSTAQDKHGEEIAVGDIVEIVYGGDYHQMVVDEITSTGFGDLLILTGKITISFPAGAARLLDRKPAAKPSKPALPPVEAPLVGVGRSAKPAASPPAAPPAPATPPAAKPAAATNERTNATKAPTSKPKGAAK